MEEYVFGKAWFLVPETFKTKNPPFFNVSKYSEHQSNVFRYRLHYLRSWSDFLATVGGQVGMAASENWGPLQPKTQLFVSV